MSDLGTNILALVLELPNTREICLNDPLSPALVSELAETEALISEALREVNILQSDMRPVNLLPVELLIHIFGFLGGGSFVVPVSHVCRRWRNVALCTPSLWTVIRESDDFLAATTFMERSNNLVLDVSLQVIISDGEFKKFHDIVTPHASRFRRLHVVVHGYRVFDFYYSLSECDLVMPALEHFSIRIIEYGFEDDRSDEERLPLCQRFFDQLESLTELTFRGTLPLREHLSHSIRSLTIADRSFDLNEVLACLEAASNLEYLALLDSVPHTFHRSTQRPIVELSRLKEFHWFQGRVVDNLLETVKLFEHLVLPGLDTSSTQFVMLLDPSKYMNSALYTPCHRFTNLFNTAVTELILEASHYASGKPARNNIVFHGRHNGETVFSVRVMRGSLGFLCVPGGMFLTSSVYVDLSKVTHLTFTSTLPYAWNRFFRTPPIWAHFLRSVPFVKVLRLHVSTPTDIIKSITNASYSNSNSDSSDSPYPPTLFIPDLQYLHLFRCGVVVVGEEEGKRRGTVCTGSSNSEKKDLLRFLATRVEFGIPIKSIVCSPEDGDGLLPAVLDLVESIEFGRPGNWAEPQFPSRMAALLEKHLN
ncbi:hypothetical protein BGW80DRAFT_1293311 [Lactifluus volemus]|nr:hypothetical protein BGW80DRAFT_1293311 [Lactifluus volemus]